MNKSAKIAISLPEALLQDIEAERRDSGQSRSEFRWASRDPPVGRRPVLLLSRNEAYEVRSRVIIAPVTTQLRGIRSEVPLGPEDGLPRRSVANLDTILTI